MQQPGPLVLKQHRSPHQPEQQTQAGYPHLLFHGPGQALQIGVEVRSLGIIAAVNGVIILDFVHIVPPQFPVAGLLFPQFCDAEMLLDGVQTVAGVDSRRVLPEDHPADEPEPRPLLQSIARPGLLIEPVLKSGKIPQGTGEPFFDRTSSSSASLRHARSRSSSSS